MKQENDITEQGGLQRQILSHLSKEYGERGSCDEFQWQINKAPFHSAISIRSIATGDSMVQVTSSPSSYNHTPFYIMLEFYVNNNQLNMDFLLICSKLKHRIMPY